MPTLHNLNTLKNRRRELRSQETVSESILWEELRNSKLGYKFKRQHSIGGYIVDFYCAKNKLIIELDGNSHDSKGQKEYDLIRDAFFNNLDYKTLRFKNEDVENNSISVLKEILNVLNQTPLLN